MLGVLLALWSSVVLAADDPPPNVLVITVDCLRADHMGVYGYERDTTPYLSRLAEESVVFESAFSTSSWTSPGVVSMLTGYYPPVHAQNGRHQWWDAELPTAVSLLRDGGYLTVGRVNDGPTIEHLGLSYGLAPYADAEELIAARTARGPAAVSFFGWAHFKEVHLPYNAAPYHRRLWGADIDTPALRHVATEGVLFKHKAEFEFTEADVAPVRALYDGAVAAVDKRIGELLEGMRGTGMLDRTIVVISADHGEELLEHGWVGHASTSHVGKAFDELIHVPLIIRVPDAALTGRVDALVSQVDVMPTLYELLGRDASELDLPMQGRSLVPLMRGEAADPEQLVFSQTTYKGWTTPADEMRHRITAVRSPTHKVLRYGGPDGDRFEAYDLVADPGELAPLAEGWETELEPLLAALDAWDSENRAGAATLAISAAERRVAAVERALADGDPVQALEHYQALLTLDRTWGLEVDPFYDHPPWDARWERLLRDGAKAVAPAVRRGGR